MRKYWWTYHDKMRDRDSITLLDPKISNKNWAPEALSAAQRQSLLTQFLVQRIDIALAHCFDHQNIPQTSSEKSKTFLRHALYTPDHESNQKYMSRGREDQFENYGS